MTHPALIAAALAALLAPAQQPAAPAPDPSPTPTPPAAAPAPTVIPAWLDQRLAALRPAQPEAYFLLAEEVADAALTDERLTATATTLFTLAFELDRRRGPTPLAASACIALAHLQRSEADRRWLRALAGSIDRRYAATDWNVPAGRAAADQTAYKAATVLGLARSGDGPAARKLMDEPDVAALLRDYERAMGTTQGTGALFRLNKTIDAWPCPQCGNERVTRGPGDAGPESKLCATCRGNPGPELTEAELIAQLRFEATLLSGIQRSWAAQVAADLGAPLRDPDPAELAPTLGVDATRTLWRNGAWVAP